MQVVAGVALSAVAAAATTAAWWWAYSVIQDEHADQHMSGGVINIQASREKALTGHARFPRAVAGASESGPAHRAGEASPGAAKASGRRSSQRRRWRRHEPRRSTLLEVGIQDVRQV